MQRYFAPGDTNVFTGPNKCVLPWRKYVYSATGRSNCSKRSLLIGDLPGAKKVKYENLLSPGCFPFHREEPGGRALLTLTVALGLGLLLQGCGTSPRGPAVPTAFETQATVVG